MLREAKKAPQGAFSTKPTETRFGRASWARHIPNSPQEADFVVEVLAGSRIFRLGTGIGEFSEGA